MLKSVHTSAPDILLNIIHATLKHICLEGVNQIFVVSVALGFEGQNIVRPHDYNIARWDYSRGEVFQE
jgi:hypothetical protein